MRCPPGPAERRGSYVLALSWWGAACRPCHGITFTGFPFTENPDEFKSFTQLAAQMNRLAKEQKRVMAKTVDETNERYSFRIWLLALGMGGEEFKTVRRVLLQPLSGNAAFKNQAMEDRWKAKQNAKRDAPRAAKARQTEESTACDPEAAYKTVCY